MYDFKEPILQLTGCHILYIENYRKLLCYTSEQIRILTKSGIIEINGCKLTIRYYSKEDLEINGTIQTICFLK